ncbi:hypothetical protein [Paraburkholderia sediminicola]|uniref:hypothetical protein n=1 Tax=Paraburkholderia sediminicola TaxID=458836 RepID=UPI0038B8D219
MPGWRKLATPRVDSIHPLVAIAGIRIQRVMGCTAITFVVSLVIYAAAVWLIPWFDCACAWQKKLRGVRGWAY